MANAAMSATNIRPARIFIKPPLVLDVRRGRRHLHLQGDVELVRSDLSGNTATAAGPADTCVARVRLTLLMHSSCVPDTTRYVSYWMVAFYSRQRRIDRPSRNRGDSLTLFR